MNAETEPEIRRYLPKVNQMTDVVKYARSKSQAVRIVEPAQIDFVINAEHCLCDGENVVIGDWQSDDKKERVTLFSTRFLLGLLVNSFFWMLDGTFKVVPTIYHQLFVIHGPINRVHRVVYPMVFALMSGKSQELYGQVFRLLKEATITLLNRTLDPTLTMSDFEISSRNAILAAFDNVRIHSCNFHLGQIIYRRLQKTQSVFYPNKKMSQRYDTEIEFAEEIRKIFALSFVSPQEIPQYFQALYTSLSQDAQLFADWFKNNYILTQNGTEPRNPPRFWSCTYLLQNELPCTQCFIEAFHKRFNNIVGRSHPGFYFLVSEIIKEIKHATVKIERIQRGEPEPKQSRLTVHKYRNISNVIANKQNLTPIEFLTGIATSLALK